MIYVINHLFFDKFFIMYPPSFFVNFLLLLRVISKEYASLFYPYVYSTTIFGIFYLLLLVLFQSAQDFHYNYFAKSFINNFHKEQKTCLLLFVMLYKALLLYIFPYNMNKTAMLYSVNYLLFYVCCSLIYIYTM